MAFIYKWIEGEDNLIEYCLKRFDERPYICEHHGHCGPAKIIKTEKEKPDGYYSIIFLLYMQSDKGVVYNIDNIRQMSYEQIRTDRTAILKR